MIQRIQTLWLLISTACAALFILMPIYKGVTVFNISYSFSIRENLFFLSGCVILATLCLIAIFQFKNRKLQKRLITLNILIIIALFISQYYLIEIYKKNMCIAQGDWQMIAILPLFMLLFHVFAYRGIVADEKLLNSADRMR